MMCAVRGQSPELSNTIGSALEVDETYRMSQCRLIGATFAAPSALEVVYETIPKRTRIIGFMALF